MLTQKQYQIITKTFSKNGRSQERFGRIPATTERPKEIVQNTDANDTETKCKRLVREKGTAARERLLVSRDEKRVLPLIGRI